MRDLEQDLKARPAVRAAVQDDAFAERLYGALCNVLWRHAEGGEPWGCSWRYAGRIVADLRGIGEDYMAYYCSGGEGVIADDVAALLATLGWTGGPYRSEGEGS